MAAQTRTVIQIKMPIQRVLHCVREIRARGVRARELLIALDGVSLDVFPQTFLALRLETANVAVEHLAGVPVFEMNLFLAIVESFEQKCIKCFQTWLSCLFRCVSLVKPLAQTVHRNG